MKIRQTARKKVQSLDMGGYGTKNFNHSVAMLFQENIKFNVFSQRKLGANIGRFFTPYYTKRTSQPYKSFPGAKKISMDDYADLIQLDHNFFDLVSTRRSGREYDKDYKISLNEIYSLLHYSYGISQRSKIEGIEEEGHVGWRVVPSAGGLYPLEIYFVMLNSHLEEGLYHYLPNENAIEQVNAGPYMDKLKDILFTDPYIDLQSAGMVAIVTSVNERTMLKYGDRGYRFILNEAGAVVNQLSLVSEALDFGSCVVGAFKDYRLEEMLDIDGVFESIQAVLTIGKKGEVVCKI
ncbi:MAG: SagB family peptide dehydrogenase [Bacteroidota bacterium]